MAPPSMPQDLKARLKASYDAIAPKYNEWAMANPAQRLKYLDRLLALLPLSDQSQKLHILELGCGCGIPVTQKLLSHPNVVVTANDLSGTQISLAKGNLRHNRSEDVSNRLVFEEGDMTALSFRDGSLDAVIGLYSMIHLPRAEQAELLGKIAGWLKPGGYLLATFTEEELESLVMDRWLDEKDWMFWSGWGRESTIELLRQVGLRVVVEEVVSDVSDAAFLWVIATR
ncbi:hypothetical protein DL769_003557 [Monosporascus sp. CRB-8-3]|nr:hypothetical protein DL769_003557 [Monosporascus sp. CRB-8-3]